MYHQTTLKNGLRVVVVPKKESLSVHLLILVGVGTNNETKDINGISHFVEHMLFKGTQLRPRAINLSSQLDALGAECNAFTTREYTGYYVSCLPDKFEQVLDILSDMYLNSVFDSSEIEKEKGVISEEINRSLNNPSHLIQDLFTFLAYGDTAYGWNTLGTKKSLKNINRQSFLDFQKKFCLAGNTVVTVAGAIDQREVVKKIQNYFSQMRTGVVPSASKIKEGQNSPALLVEYHKGHQTNLVMGFRTFGIHHRDIYTALVLAGILGGAMSSRLFQKIREEMGAAYSIGAYQTGFSDYGYLGISGGVKSDKIIDVIKVILAEISILKRDLVGEEELARVKDGAIGSIYLHLETPADLASFYGTQVVMEEPVLTPEEYGKKIKAVTAQDVRKLARRIFTKSGLNLAVLGPHKNKQIFVDILTL